MSDYQRFQTLSAAQQALFLPEAPVWVSRWQLSRDLESGKRLLQVRMVNCAEKTVRRVFLRVVCLGADRRRLTQLELLAMPGCNARPSAIFGDDLPVELFAAGTVYVEVYPQRVCFADGSAWDEPTDPGYLAFRAEPVRRDDPHYETLAARARSGGVLNDCYFRLQQGMWVCSCGMPNATRSLRCARCGAGRLWLERHMDPNLIDAPAVEKAPEPPPAPVVYPTPSVTVVPAPIRSEPAPQPTIIVQTQPEPEPQAPPPSHAGRTAAILCALLLALALGLFCAWRWLRPYLRYQQAMEARAIGDYDRAVAILKELDAYRDSPQKLEDSLLRKALALMGEGEYRRAMELLETLDGHEEELADCLYSLGVLAYNEGDPEGALDYVNQLSERFPDYDKTETLAEYCYFSLGNRAAADAAAGSSPEQQLALYETARSYFQQAGDYEDSPTRELECGYRMALIYRDQGELPQAIAQLEELGDYGDARALLLECMFLRVRDNISQYPEDPLLQEYLELLLEADYPGAEELAGRTNGTGYLFRLSRGEGESLSEPVGRLDEVSILYRVEATDEAVPVLVLVRCLLPDGREGRALLNPNRDAEGRSSWAELRFPTDCQEAGWVTLSFYDAEIGESLLLEQREFAYDPAEADPEETAPPTEDGEEETGAPADETTNDGGTP